MVYCRCTHRTSNDENLTDRAAEEVAPTFTLEIDISVNKKYPFEVPVVKVVEGANIFPKGAIRDGTNILNSPADSDIWTPSHTIGSLATTTMNFLKSGSPWPEPREQESDGSKTDEGPILFRVGQV